MLAWISLDHGSSPSLSRREHWRNNVKESFAGLSVWETSSLRTEPGTSERKSVFEPLSRRICRICSTHVCFKRKDFLIENRIFRHPRFLSEIKFEQINVDDIDFDSKNWFSCLLSGFTRHSQDRYLRASQASFIDKN